MSQPTSRWTVRAPSILLAALCAATAAFSQAGEAPAFPENPRFQVDLTWPQLPLPNDWTLGEVGGITVDSQDNVWIVQRPRTLFFWERAAAETPPAATCCVPAPAVIQFDPSGKVLRAWGGPGEGYDWPSSEHGIHVDYKGNVWIAGNLTARAAADSNTPPDGMVLKFSPEGKFLLQIGSRGPSKGSLDPTQLAGASDIAVYPKTNEVFISDGYHNNRIIVFDADTGEFKRMWGAYGKPPTDERLPPYDPNEAPPKQFRNAHCLRVSDDGLVYVCDRDNNRVQVFRIDGTFVTEWILMRNTRAGGQGAGSVAHIAFWPDRGQSMLIVADLGNNTIRAVRRSDGQIVHSFGRFGNYAGQLNRLHNVAVDSKGNIYTSEATGKRVQKWTHSGR